MAVWLSRVAGLSYAAAVVVLTMLAGPQLLRWPLAGLGVLGVGLAAAAALYRQRPGLGLGVALGAAAIAALCHAGLGVARVRPLRPRERVFLGACLLIGGLGAVVWVGVAVSQLPSGAQ